MNNKLKLLMLILFLFSIANSGCLSRSKYYRDRTGVIKTKNRTDSGVNTGALPEAGEKK